MAVEKASRAMVVIPPAKARSIVKTDFVMPAMLEVAGPRVRKRVLEFFGASIRNDNTRKAYMKSCTAFFDFLDDNGVEAIEDIEPLQVAAYLEAMQAEGRSVATQKQHRA
jgi:integrase family protein with SAM-like domain